MIHSQISASHAFNYLLNQSTGINFRKEKIGIESDGNMDPWSSGDSTWSDEIVAIKKDLPKLKTRKEIVEKFKSLRLHNQKITQLDTDFLQFRNLLSLSLTGNQLTELSNVPSSLEILHLNANSFTIVPDLHALSHLVHLGMS
jgi:Leucine-rich repeat (LRR) protein